PSSVVVPTVHSNSPALLRLPNLFLTLFRLSLLSTFSFLFFFTAPATTEIYTLSLHDALPILIFIIFFQYSCKKLPNSTRSVTIQDRKSTRLNSSHVSISYAVFCLKKKK